MGPYRKSRLSLILFMSAIITLSGCATRVSFHSADQTTTVDGTLFKPDGAGPFPAVVLLHGCGGIRTHFVQWAGAIRDMGYVALLVDSFRPRDHYGRACEGAATPAECARAAKFPELIAGS